MALRGRNICNGLFNLIYWNKNRNMLDYNYFILVKICSSINMTVTNTIVHILPKRTINRSRYSVYVRFWTITICNWKTTVVNEEFQMKREVFNLDADVNEGLTLTRACTRSRTHLCTQASTHTHARTHISNCWIQLSWINKVIIITPGVWMDKWM